jgi:hypothetical protein
MHGELNKLTSAKNNFFALVCQTVDFNPDPESAAYKAMLAWYWSYWLMVVAIIDTFILVARKKFHRVNKILIFADSSSILHVWVRARYGPQA